MRWGLLCILGIWLCVLPGSATAERYHVRSGGVLVSGGSTANDWSIENCYSSISLAALSASPSDSLLLYSEMHSIDSSIVLPSFLGNMNLDDNFSAVIVQCGVSAQLVIPSALALFEGRGLTLTS